MKQFLLIRHGKTRGNQERRYIGNPWEPLCPEGIAGVEALAASGLLPAVDTLACGPALRCRQTMDILFPGRASEIVDAFREIDFGVFKDKNADDLLGDREYESWLNTNCMGDIPGGDSVEQFKIHCCHAFDGLYRRSDENSTTALVIHGGNIMSILETFALPKRGFYDYHIANGAFILCRWEEGALTETARGEASL